MDKKSKKDIGYKIKKSSRAKNMRISVYSNAKIIVTAPKRLSNTAIEKFIKQKWSWIESKIELFNHFKDNKLVKLTDRDYKENRDKAYEIIKDRVEHFNKILGYKYNRICIRDQKTRWGSCSSKGNLNFNYRLIFLPDNLRDYVIVHELCHLKEMNHSKNFWKLVESIVPEYDSMRKEMRRGYGF